MPIKKFKWFKFESITTKLVITYFLIMVLTLMLFSYYILSTTKTYLYEDEKLNVTTKSNVVASFAVEYIEPETHRFSSSSFGKFISEFGLDSRMRVMLLNNDLKVVFDSQNNHNMLGVAQVRPGVLAAVNGTDGFAEYKNDESGIVFDAAAPIFNDNGDILGVVEIVYEPENITKIHNTLMGDMTFLILAIALLVGIIIFVMANLVSKRIVDFTSKITSMSDDGILDEKLDISGHDEISRLGEAFNMMSEKVVNLEKQRVQFVSDASHELKTPLSSIKLMADSILQTPDISIDYVREFLGDMNDEVDRLNRIVNKLLYITKMDIHHNNDIKKYELVNLNDIISGIEKNLQPLAKKEDITLVFTSPGDIFLMANRDVLWQGIYNIVDNAIKYTDSNGYVLVSAKRECGKIIIEVRDTGVGISNEEIDKIFDRFYRVDKARDRATGGTGLGLSIALGAVKYHNGEIDVKSEPQKGSTFTITLTDTVPEESDEETPDSPKQD